MASKIGERGAETTHRMRLETGQESRRRFDVPAEEGVEGIVMTPDAHVTYDGYPANQDENGLTWVMLN